MTAVTRDTYRAELATLRGDVRSMGDAVLDQLDDALSALATGDEALAQSVIDGDAAINERYLAIEDDCIDLFALQQPVASDLRFVTASFKISTDLERVGDLATNLAGYAIVEERTWEPDLEIGAVGSEAREMVADALDAYQREDVDACHAIADRDDDIDALCARASDRLVRDLVEGEVIDDTWGMERLLDDVSRLLLTIRDVERIADHAVNVAARTCYAADGDKSLIV